MNDPFDFGPQKPLDIQDIKEAARRSVIIRAELPEITQEADSMMRAELINEITDREKALALIYACGIWSLAISTSLLNQHKMQGCLPETAHMVFQFDLKRFLEKEKECGILALRGAIDLIEEFLEAYQEREACPEKTALLIFAHIAPLYDRYLALGVEFPEELDVN